jgi:transcriptional regulator with PAS, ATPase and Fis domain
MDIEKGVQEGQFRQDLFYRLNTGRIIIPPLRDRQNEILPLATMFLNRFTSQKGKRFAGISDKAAKVLQSYTWPGNVRELMNVVEYIVFMYDDNELKLEHLNNLPQFKNNGYVEEEGMGPVVLENFSLPPDGLDLTQLNDNIIIRALEMHNGNKTKTAAYLGITRRVLQYRLKRLEGD